MMRGTRDRDQSVELVGRRLPSPFLTAPIGVAEMVHAEADLALARGARDAEVPVIMSTQASRSMEEIAAELGDAPRWYQLYWSSDDELAESLLRRAEASGCEAIVVTLDTALLGWRTEDLDHAWLPFARGMGIAQFTSDPVFQHRVRERLAAADADAASPDEPLPPAQGPPR